MIATHVPHLQRTGDVYLMDLLVGADAYTQMTYYTPSTTADYSSTLLLFRISLTPQVLT
jgi:hypothetical protein